MKKLSLVVAVVSVLTLVQSGMALADDGWGERKNYTRGADWQQSERQGQRNGRDENRRGRDSDGANRQERFAGRVDNRQGRQWDRIRDGREDGSVTRREGQVLRQDQRRIAELEERFGDDGRYDRHERRILDRAQDRASERIFVAKHNDHYRGYDHDRGNHYGWSKHHHPHYVRWCDGHDRWEWTHRDHYAYPAYYVERRMIYAPPESATFDLDLHFRNLSIGVSGSQQF